MEMPANDLRLLEPAAPESLLPGSWVWLWAGAAAVIVLAAAIICWYVRCRRHAGRTSPGDNAAAALAEALARLDALRPANARDAATSVSLILRRYLAQATGEPALYETHEEFIARHDALAALDTGLRDRTAATFSDLAAMKYAPVAPQHDPQPIVGEARQLLQSLHGATHG